MEKNTQPWPPYKKVPPRILHPNLKTKTPKTDLASYREIRLELSKTKAFLIKSSTGPIIVHSQQYSLEKYVTQRSHLIYRSPFSPQPLHWRRVSSSHNKWASKWQTPFTEAANAKFKTRQIQESYRVLKISRGDKPTKRVQNTLRLEQSRRLLLHATTR